MAQAPDAVTGSYDVIIRAAGNVEFDGLLRDHVWVPFDDWFVLSLPKATCWAKLLKRTDPVTGRRILKVDAPKSPRPRADRPD